MKEVEIEQFLDGIKLPTLSSEHANMMEESISQEEIKAALQVLKVSTAPGLEGFTSEFYKIFGEV